LHPTGTGELVVQSRSAEDGHHLWADVYLDGRPVGQSTLTLKAVPAGQHRLEVRRSGYATPPQVVTIRPGERTRAAFVLRRGAR
jgi:hypothetical protein